VDARFDDWAHRLHSLIDDAVWGELYKPDNLRAYAETENAHYLMQSLISTFADFIDREEEHMSASSSSGCGGSNSLSSSPLPLSSSDGEEESEPREYYTTETSEFFELERAMNRMERGVLFMREAGIDCKAANDFDVTDEPHYLSRTVHFVQQCAEKSLKGYLLTKMDDLEELMHEHNLTQLAAIILDPELKKLAGEIECLGNQTIYDCNNFGKVTPLAVRCRYPSKTYDYTLTSPCDSFSDVELAPVLANVLRIYDICGNFVDDCFLKFYAEKFDFLKNDQTGIYNKELFPKLLTLKKLFPDFLFE